MKTKALLAGIENTNLMLLLAEPEEMKKIKS